MISSKPEHFKEGPGQVRSSRPGPPLSWHSNFCRGLRDKSKISAPNKKISPGGGAWLTANLSGQLWRDRQFLPPARQLIGTLKVGSSEKEEASYVYSLLCAYCQLPGQLNALGTFVCHSGQQQLSSYRKLGKHSQQAPVVEFLCS